MKVTIEIDGKSIDAKVLEALEARPDHAARSTAEPPPELLAAARRLGAQSAGIAAFSMSADKSVALDAKAVVAVHADEDAGAAPGYKSPRRAVPATKSRRSKASVRK